MRNMLTAALVSLALAPALFAQADNPNIERGFSPEKVYHFDGIDAINLFNGNVNFSVPVGQTYPVGGKISYGFTLSYGGNNWEIGTRSFEGQIGDQKVVYESGFSYPSSKPNAGFGWILSVAGERILGATMGPAGGTPTGPQISYMTGDGATHRLYTTLHPTVDAEVAQAQQTNNRYYYSRDNSYLRYDSQTRTLESPDGVLRDFDASGNMVQMRDRFGNWVQIAYNETTDPNPVSSGNTSVHVWDSVGRHHHVYFKPTATYFESYYGEALAHESVAELRLAGFNGSVQRYIFKYQGEDNGQWTTLDRPTGAIVTDATDGQTLATVLTSVQSEATDAGGAPWRYSFTYLTNGFDSGALKTLTLPSGGTVEYDYTSFAMGRWLPPTVGGKGAPIPDIPASVKTRTMKDAFGRALGWRTYNDDGVDSGGSHQSVSRTVTEYDANGAILQKSRHHFSMCPQSNVPCGLVDLPGEYGLPVSRGMNGFDDLQLSVEHFGWVNADGTIDWSRVSRSTYVKYEADVPLGGGGFLGGNDENRRVVAEASVYGDDGNRWMKTVYSDFDGYGNYRRTDTSGTFDGTNAQTTVTKFNPSQGTLLTADSTFKTPSGFTPLAAGASWILNTYTYQTVTSAPEAPPGQTATSKTAMTVACFDNNGFLRRRRVLRSNVTNPATPPLDAADLLAIFSESSGNVVQERYLGGDWGPAPSTSDTCNASYSGEAYRIDHTWSNGVEATARYVNDQGAAMTFLNVDNDIDLNTGLVKASRSRSDGSFALVTNFDYDFLGRVKSARSSTSMGAPAAGGVSYTYRFSPPSVDVDHENAANPPGNTVVQADGTVTYLPHMHFEFDGFGRVTKESKELPNATTSRVTTYNALGWKTSESEWEAAPNDVTRYLYDPFGRPLTITAPDQSVVRQSYAGDSSMSRTVQIGGGTSCTASGLVAATTVETYDGFHRLRTVTEPDFVPTETLYTYDVGGRLAGVCGNHSGDVCGQTRTFVYDNRGFLTSESHPEKGGTGGNGTTYYFYDARGHARRRYEGAIGGQFDLTFSYDRAERLKTIAETYPRTGSSAGRILKSFDFGSDNAAGDLRNGQLTRATRFNWFDSRDTNVQIAEQYVYGGVGGQASSRTTYEYDCAISSGDTCNAVAPNAAKRSFTQGFTYDVAGALRDLTYPSCGGDCTISSTRHVFNSFSRGLLADVQFLQSNPPENSIAYSANGMISTVTHANGVTDTQAVDPNMMQRPRSFSTTGAHDAAACAPPTVTTHPQSSSVSSGATVTLTAGGVGDSQQTLHFQWYQGPSGDTSRPVAGQTGAQYQFVATSTATFWARVSNGCSATSYADTEAATVTVCSTPSITVQPVSTQTTVGISRTLSVTASGSSLRYQWYQNSQTMAGEVGTSVTVTPSATTAYSVVVTGDCGSTTSQSATVTVYNLPTAPPSVVAAGNNDDPRHPYVQVTWSTGGASAPGAVSYEIQRAAAGIVGYVPMASTSYGTISDHNILGAASGEFNAYAYRVVTIDANGARSAPSSPDLSVIGTFTDDPLPSLPFIRAVHFTELMKAIDAVRATAGMAAAFPAYSVSGYVSANLMAQMRSALGEARRGLSLPAVTYVSPSITGGQLIRRTDVENLRTGVK